MKPLFIKIQDTRYRVSTIKRYGPVPGDGSKLHIYFSPIGSTQRVTHKFDNDIEVKDILMVLDDIFIV